MMQLGWISEEEADEQMGEKKRRICMTVCEISKSQFMPIAV